MKKGKASTILLVIVFLTGLGLLLYPTVSDYWNSRHQTQAIHAYEDDLAGMDQSRFDELRQEAEAYNRSLLTGEVSYRLTAEQEEQYAELLDIGGIGIMGYIDIPKIAVTLPIYHGTDSSALQAGVGHIEWTSLPARGESVHCVLSGHRGLPSSRLFTDLPELAEGDIFTLTVLDQVFTYEVDRILIVQPEDVEELLITPNREYCTLVTCTPYGINSHRILVRGELVSDEKQAAALHITADAVQIEPQIVAPVLAIPLLLLLLAVMFLPRRRE